MFYTFSDKSTAESLVSLRLPYTFRGVSPPSDVALPVQTVDTKTPKIKLKLLLIPGRTFLVILAEPWYVF